MRHGRNLLMLLVVVAGGWLLSACDATTTTFVVDSSADLPDGTPGDGRCAAPDGSCTLRAAVMEANTDPGEDLVVLSDGVGPKLSIAPAAPDDASNGDLDVTAPLSLSGGDALISGGRVDRVFDVTEDASLALVRVTIADGATEDDGGAVRSRGAVQLLGVTLERNAAGGSGGGVALTGTDPHLSAVGTTVARNRATDGGAIHADDGAVDLLATTLSGNASVGGDGSAVALDGTATAELTDSTVTANDGGATGGAGIHDGGSGTTLSNSVVANQAVGPDCGGMSPATAGYNADSDGTCLPAPAIGDRTVVDAGLSALADHGGPTPTHLPTSGSPLVDAGAPACFVADQRAVLRPLDGDGDGSVACDTGAVEAPTPPLAPLAVVAQLDVANVQFVTVSWTPAAGGPPADGHAVEVTTDGGSTWTDLGTVAVPESELVHRCGGPAVTCQFRVAAVAGEARSTTVLSDEVTTPNLPGAPRDARAELAGLGSMLVTWSPPASDGGTPVTGYSLLCTTDVYSSGGVMPGATWQKAGSTTQTSIELRCGQSIGRAAFQIAAQNAMGLGPWALADGLEALPPGPLPDPFPEPPCVRCG